MMRWRIRKPRLKKDKKIITLNDILELEDNLNTLEDILNDLNHRIAELSNTDEFCTWMRHEGFYLHKTSCGHEDTYDDSYRYCPYCSKSIKVVNYREDNQEKSFSIILQKLLGCERIDYEEEKNKDNQEEDISSKMS